MPTHHKVISASAGSGKTHRLALEYISIILKNLYNPEFHFSRILVVTFTRKATAEIRAKIYSLLDDITQKVDSPIIAQIERLSGIQLTPQIITDLKKVVQNLKAQKHQTRISTIDSLIDTIFKAMIAPQMKLTSYTIDENANQDIWEQIFEQILSDELINTLRQWADISPHKRVKYFGNIFARLINHRWLLDMVTDGSRLYKSAYTGSFLHTQEEFDAERSRATYEFQDLFGRYLGLLKIVLQQKFTSERGMSQLLVKMGQSLLGRNLTPDNFDASVAILLETGIFQLSKSTIAELSKGDTIKLYSGIYIRNKPLGEITPLKEAFLRFVYYEYMSVEYFQILRIWEMVLQSYDQIKLRSGMMTFNDIAYYTYKYLFLEGNGDSSDVVTASPTVPKKRFIIENVFYEFLAVRNQYLLIDEFQDTSLLQFMILAPMIADLTSGNSVYEDTAVIVVGDEKQSIYSWRDGEKGLLNFMQSFLQTPTESLSTCYRSVPAIVDFVNRLFVDTHYSDLFTTNQRDNWVYDGSVVSGRPSESGMVQNFFYQQEKGSEEDPYQVFIEKLLLPTYTQYKDTLGEVAILARTNNDLLNISRQLAVLKIPYTLESSHSVWEHTIPQAILWLCRYIQYRDYTALLKFLRSDVCLINTTRLKKIALDISPSFTTNGDSSPDETMSIIDAIYRKYHSSEPNDAPFKNPLILCRAIIDTFNLISIFHSETEIKNLHLFMSVIAEFLENPQGFATDLDGFIRFAEDKYARGEHKQSSTKTENAIQLITIHKSKGLGFDTVFVYQDCKAHRGNLSETLLLKYIVDNSSYDRLTDLFLTINYKPIIKELFSAEFANINQKDETEEMNALYVAMTRAKTNLAVFWLYTPTDLEKNTLENRVVKVAGDIVHSSDK